MEDLKSHTNIQHKALNEIGLLLKQVALKEPHLFQLDQDTLKLFDTINKTTDNQFLKKVIQERLAAYPTVFPTVELQLNIAFMILAMKKSSDNARVQTYIYKLLTQDRWIRICKDFSLRPPSGSYIPLKLRVSASCPVFA